MGGYKVITHKMKYWCVIRTMYYLYVNFVKMLSHHRITRSISDYLATLVAILEYGTDSTEIFHFAIMKPLEDGCCLPEIFCDASYRSYKLIMIQNNT